MVAELVPISRPVPVSMTVNSHLDTKTGLGHKLWPAEAGAVGPWVTITVGDYSGGVTLYVHDLEVLEELAGVVDRARHELAEELGLLPNGEPCGFVDVFGSIEWNEHDHDQCLEALADEPIRLVPVEPERSSGPGTAWERHDDPTVEDNPLDDDEWDDADDNDEDDGMCLTPGQRVLRAEGWM